MIRRARHSKATGKASIETAYGVTSHTPDTANAQNILTLNRGHWCIENTAHHCLDWSWDEDRSRIRTGNGPENTTRLRRFAIGLIKARGRRGRPDPAKTQQKCPLCLRLPQNDRQYTATTQPLTRNARPPSTGRANRQAEGPAPDRSRNAEPKTDMPARDRQTIARPPPWLLPGGHAPIRKSPHR